MDETRFDRLTKSLLALPTRRRKLVVLGGGVLGSLVTALVDGSGQAKGDGSIGSEADRNRRPRGFQCKTAGTKCVHTPPKGKTSTGKLCRKCCQTFRKVSKRVGVCCIPNGQPCESAAECCLGSCSVGLCQNEVIQLPLCVAYGGNCTQNGECCDGVPCIGARCQFPLSPPPPPPSCIPYGQTCSSVAACCDNVPCSGGLCRFN